ncbi:pinopsin-like [Tenebrio molitor]|uniref:pinopsin-like n=1 Tax=Tenebrio molitor TaxID=7067 RepID=UPI00362494D5
MIGINSTEENNLTRSETELLIPAEGYITAAVFLFFIGFFGFFLNLSILLFMWKKKQLWTPLNIILFNLIFSDFLVSVLGNPWTFLSAVNYNWIFGKTGCVLYGFIMSLLGITSITTLTVLAFERYLIIAQPLYSNHLNFRNVTYLLVSIWLYSLTLTTPPLLGWGEYVNEAANISCSVNWEEKSVNSMTYILFLFTFGLFVPLTIIIFSYVNIILTMKRNAFRMGQVTKAESKVANMIFIMIIAFLTAWAPYAILALIIQFGDASVVTPGIAVFPALLAKSSICYNPIIYIGLNAQFQQAWKRACTKSRMTSSRDVLATSRVVSHEPVTETEEKVKEMKSNKLELVRGLRKDCRDADTDVTMF